MNAKTGRSESVASLSADEIIALLKLEPHPEGGHFRETFRDGARQPDGGRAASTAIYFLLRENEISLWHKVDAAEVWHFYTGAPLELGICTPAGNVTSVSLSPDLKAGHQLQCVVPANHWQQARSLGAYSLVGCTVAPGFEFSGFELAPSNFTPGW